VVEVVWNVGSLLWILGAGLDSFSTIDPGARTRVLAGQERIVPSELAMMRGCEPGR